MSKKPSSRDLTTLFSWGYWGWGTSAPELVKATDAVEAARDFNPPVFVDIRLLRGGRAPGFRGDTFKKLVGDSRYHWIDDLGNAAIRRGRRQVSIKNPAAVDRLLDLALRCRKTNQRVIFFCACQVPGTPAEIGCHRLVVAGLVLEAAAKRGTSVEVVEWPGGEPRLSGFEIKVSDAAFRALRSGRKTIVLPTGFSLSEMAGLPFGSIAKIRSAEAPQSYLYAVTGPAQFKKSGWCLPVHETLELGAPVASIKESARDLRERWGYKPRRQV